METLQRADDLRHFAVVDRALVRLFPRADVAEPQNASVDRYVLGLNRRQAVGRFGTRALFVADPKEALIDQADDRGQHAIAIEVRAAQVAADLTPQARKRFAELDDALELLFFALRAKPRVIEILRAASLVDADRLQGRRIAPRDPDVAPGRRHTYFSDSRQRFLIDDGGAVGVLIAEAAVLGPDPPNAVEIESPPSPHRFSRHARAGFCENGAAC